SNYLTFNQVRVKKATFPYIGSMGQMYRSNSVEFKIVIIPVLAWVDKKFYATVKMGSTVGSGLPRQYMIFGNVKYQPKGISHMGNPEFYIGSIWEFRPVNYLDRMKLGMLGKNFFDIMYGRFSLVFNSWDSNFFHIFHVW